MDVIDTECSICTETFIDPRLLACGHTFCLKCLKTEFPGDPEHRIVCPLCRSEVRIFKCPLEDLPKNLEILQLIEEAKMCDSVNDYILCEACAANDEIEESEIPAATMHCIMCEESHCDSCSKVHREQNLPKYHNIVPLEEATKKKISEMKELSESDEEIFSDSCNDDKENEIDEVPTATMFCTNCEESHRGSCSKVHREQKLSTDHNIVPIEKKMKEKVSEIKEPSKCDEEIIFCDSTEVDKENDNDKKQEKESTFQETPTDRMLGSIKEHKENKNSKSLIDQTVETDNIKDDSESKAIWGVAKINDELFVVRESSLSSSKVWQVNEKSFQYMYLWGFSGSALDMTGDSRNRRLYISRCIESDNEIMISVHDMNEAGRPSEIPTHSWRVHVGRYATLSITSESNILLTLMERRKLVEYSYNGKVEEIYREIDIDDIKNPLHAVKQSSDTYVVCHGENRDEKHRVCIVNARGHMLKEFCLKSYSDVNMSVVPMYLALDSKGSIIVAENRNGRVVKLNADLTVANVLQTTRDGMRGPCRLHLDDTSGKIIVAINKHGWSSGNLSIRKTCDQLSDKLHQ